MEPDNQSRRTDVVRQHRSPGRALGRAALAAVLVLGTASALVQAPLVAAQGASQVAPGDISGLIRAVADATARLDATRENIAVAREDVNKTLVDLQMARVDLDRAIAEADRAAGERAHAESGVESARSTLDDYSRLLHRQGTAPGAASALLDPTGPEALGLRREYLQRAAADQRGVVGDMIAAAEEASRRESEAAAAREAAEQRYSDAAARRDSAENQVSSVSAEVATLESEVEGLTRELEEQRAALAAAGATPAGPADGVPLEVTADEEALRAEAVRALADQPEAGRQAADIALALPSHLDLGAIRQFTGGSSDELTRAVGGTIDAGSVGAAVDAGINGDTEAIVQQVADAIARADFGSLADGPAAPAAPAAPGKGGENAGTPSNSSRVETVINRAMSQLGVPYAWGGGDANGPTKGIRDGGVADRHGDYNKIGFDCSGLMIYAFAGVGEALPHYTGYQYTSGPQYPVATRKRGDMLFWPGHVALYLGDGKMIEAPQSGDVVKISPVRMAGIKPMVVRLV